MKKGLFEALVMKGHTFGLYHLAERKTVLAAFFVHL